MTDPYRGIATLYELEYGGAEADLRGYADRGGRGRLLVLGCGTGRVCRGLERSREVVGLDRSPDMLGYARGRGGSTTYVEGDMTSFQLGAFEEIVAPNSAFSFLLTRREQLACLESCHAALPAGGRLTLDLPFPDFRLLSEPHSAEAIAWEGRVDGEPVRRTREVFRDAALQQLRLVDRYYLGGTPTIESTLHLRLVFPHEAEWMLEAAGFYLDRADGDHLGSPLRADSDRLLLHAVCC